MENASEVRPITRAAERPAPAKSLGFELAAAIGAASTIVAGVWWWITPSAYPLTEPEPLSQISGPWPVGGSVILLALGVLGLVSAGVIATIRRIPRETGPGTRRRVAVGVAATIAVLQILAFLGIGADSKVLVAAGYLLALAGPPVLLALLAVAAWRHTAVRYVLAATVVVGGGYIWWIGAASADTLTPLFREIGAGLADAGPAIGLAVACFGIGCVWVVVLLRLLPASARAGEAWALRWCRPLTIAAAVTQLPYPLVRMTWLTPWPQFGPDRAELIADPGLLLFGVSLGLAAFGGVVLTIGLIRPWGEVFPRWIPLLGGRIVPPGPPAVAGLLVGAAEAISGRVFVIAELGSDSTDWLFLGLMPLWASGPLLMAASVAYYLRRRATSAREAGRDSDRGRRRVP